MRHSKRRDPRQASKTATVAAVGLAVLALLAALPTANAATSRRSPTSDPGAVIRQRALPRPGPGRTVVDPSFRIPIARLSALSRSGGFETPIYSQLQAFSPGNKYVLLTGSAGYVVRTRNSGRRVRLNTSSWNAPRWDPATPGAVLHFDSNADATVRVQRTNVVSRRTRTLFTFPPRYRTSLNNQSFDEVSRNGRWMAGMITRSDGDSTIFALDLKRRRLTVQRPISSYYSGQCATDPTWGRVEPDWIGVSPLGRYLVIQWPRDGTQRCSGLETFSLSDGAFVGRVYDGHQHGDLGVDRTGKAEFFMAFEMYHPSGNMTLGTRALPGRKTVSPPRYLTALPWGNGGHISCQGPNGLCLVSTSGDPTDGWGPLERELFIQGAAGGVRRLAHHRSSGCGYFAQPRATWSRDGRFAIFASDWGTGSGNCDGLERSDPYVIRISR